MARIAGILHTGGQVPSADAIRRLAEHHQLDVPEPSKGAMLAADQRYDGAITVVLDGWIDDIPDLVRRAGHTGPVDGPAHAVAIAYKKWGIELFDRLDGEFAVAVWHPPSRRLVLARDRMGTRPLFWTRSGPNVAFATALPALLDLPWVERRLAREHLAEYLSFGTVHAPRTLVRGVHQVEPAHWLRVDADDLTTRRWWRPHYAPVGTKAPRPSEVVPTLQSAVERAVQRRMRPGLRPALYLSGGLGSTAIAAAARTLGRTLPSYTVSLSDDPHPESPFAGRIARLLNLEHHEVIVESRDVTAAFDSACSAMGQPVAAASAILLQLLADTAATGADVVFSGDGSEELFGGRMLDGLSRSISAATAHSRLPSPVRSLLAPVLTRSARGRRMRASPADWGLTQGLGGTHLFGVEERSQLLTDPTLVSSGVRQRVLAPFYADNPTDPINAILHAWLRSRLIAGALVRTGRTTDAAGIDARYPLLDREVVSMATALPGRSKVARGPGSLHTRWPLRAMLTGILPPPLLNRPKRSLPMLHGWLCGAGRLFMEARIRELTDASHGLFQAEALMDLRQRAITEAGATQRLWALFFLQRWIDANRLS